MERVSTGIAGLDGLLSGGFPKGSTTLVSGGTGTGKSLFGLQYLYYGAKEEKQPGLYVTLETSTSNLSWDMESFNWDFKALQDLELLKIYRMKLVSNSSQEFEREVKAQLEVIARTVKELNIQRLVLDSSTAFSNFVKEPGRLRYMLYELSSALKELNATSILTAETQGLRDQYSAYGVEEFVADGVISLYFTPPNRSLFIRKMRGTSHSKKVHPLDISSKGVSVKPQDEVLWEALNK
ncbi:MAG: ATPase domain-containing protein [Candidatus Diapherotrites archaeon]